MMSDTVRDAIAAHLAELDQIVDTPEDPLEYGSDLSCATELDPAVTELPSDSILLLGQSIVRRLDCPRGQLLDDLDYGISLRRYVNTGTTDREIRSLSTRIFNEVTKDDRVESLTVKVDPGAAGESIAVELVVTPADTGEVFRLVLTVTPVDILLESIA